MEQKFQNRLNMWRAVLFSFAQHEGEYPVTIALTNSVAQLADLVRQLEAAGTAQQHATSGEVQDKNQYRLALADDMLSIAGALRAYAIDIRDESLYAQADIRRRALLRLPSSELRDRLQSVFDCISDTTYTAITTDYGISADFYNSARLRLHDLGDTLAQPRVAIAIRKSATQLIPQIMKKGTTLLRKIDGLMEGLRSQYPRILAQYHNARIVVDVGTRHRKADVGETLA